MFPFIFLLIDFLNIKRIFPHKWVLVKVFTGKWSINDDLFGDLEDKFCTFEIYYSKNTDRIKIKTKGYKPKNHNIYPLVVQWANIYLNSKRV